jgi:hypothetical protein
VPTFVDRGVSRGQRGGSPTAVNLSFLYRHIKTRSQKIWEFLGQQGHRQLPKTESGNTSLWSLRHSPFCSASLRPGLELENCHAQKAGHVTSAYRAWFVFGRSVVRIVKSTGYPHWNVRVSRNEPRETAEAVALERRGTKAFLCYPTFSNLCGQWHGQAQDHLHLA